MVRRDIGEEIWTAEVQQERTLRAIKGWCGQSKVGAGNQRLVQVAETTPPVVFVIRGCCIALCSALHLTCEEGSEVCRGIH
jgi:hypothetical protein